MGVDKYNELNSRFQFTHPGRGATQIVVIPSSVISPFQFTHPGRGATPNISDIYLFLFVSIHAPREGCDV